MSQTDALMREVALLYLQAQRTTAACCDIKSQTQSQVITELGQHGAMTPLSLADRLGFEKSWMSRVVARLVDEGLIVKAPNEADGRSYLLQLTEHGAARYEHLNRVLNAHADRIMGAIPEPQREGVQQALVLLRDALLGEADSLEDLALECAIS